MFGLDREYSDQEIEELGRRIEALDVQVDKLFQDLGVTPEEIAAYIANRDNFTEENWALLQKERQKLDERLDRELENVPDRKRVGKNYEDRNVASHWLYVK